jgi:hypothetical protein
MAGIKNRGLLSDVLKNMKALKKKYGENATLIEIVAGESKK